MRIHDAADTAALLPYPALSEAIARVLGLAAVGEAQAPERLHVSLPGGNTMLVMPAFGPDLAMTKLLTVHPDNPGQGLPAIQGEVVVMETNTGRRLGVLDGATLTSRRTAALSLLAARTLAPNPDGPLLVVGAGAQARAHVEAFAEGLSVKEVAVFSRTTESAERLAAHARSLGLRARAVARPEEVLASCPLIVTATTSFCPVLPALVRDDAFVAAVGAFKPTMCELSPELVRSAALYCDVLEGVRAEAGDFIQAEVDWREVVPLAAALGKPRPERGPVVFKSVGHALFDLAAAMLAFEKPL
ncbi:ornithine cyclodeaminase/mu-crystallin [Desulfovibrio sp. X2]|uniref:delta(1)-pyrroline-2-carboxylate reductase family protein n=1 Tax=Desulfovibrio sp. X2 TaxID=941449 RepID=UPI000358E7CC|nr:delta(1)-pyrroline-2-carboxylate reductase family protein [Desulfovibrio sp. X2]EPR37368.1 ornithine cyclodeaminase/mu-crystallin [Desulfovibrio sp. X2]